MEQPIIKKERYTYEDYVRWPDDIRCELIDGEINMMSSPSATHQRLVRSLSYMLTGFLLGKRCEVFGAPFDVLLESAGRRDTVVQPDILVVCDSGKITQKCIKGAPDMVIEVLSPSSAVHDLMVKRQIYERSGVREYIVVDPDGRKLVINTLADGRYDMEITGEGQVKSTVLDGFSIDVNALFEGIAGDNADGAATNEDGVANSGEV